LIVSCWSVVAFFPSKVHQCRTRNTYKENKEIEKTTKPTRQQNRKKGNRKANKTETKNKTETNNRKRNKIETKNKTGKKQKNRKGNNLIINQRNKS
jgi:hypothetical protein